VGGGWGVVGGGWGLDPHTACERLAREPTSGPLSKIVEYFDSHFLHALNCEICLIIRDYIMCQEICQVNLFIFKYVYNCCDHDSRISTGRWVGWGVVHPPLGPWTLSPLQLPIWGQILGDTQKNENR